MGCHCWVSLSHRSKTTRAIIQSPYQWLHHLGCVGPTLLHHSPQYWTTTSFKFLSEHIHNTLSACDLLWLWVKYMPCTPCRWSVTRRELENTTLKLLKIHRCLLSQFSLHCKSNSQKEDPIYPKRAQSLSVDGSWQAYTSLPLHSTHHRTLQVHRTPATVLKLHKSLVKSRTRKGAVRQHSMCFSIEPSRAYSRSVVVLWGKSSLLLRLSSAGKAQPSPAERSEACLQEGWCLQAGDSRERSSALAPVSLSGLKEQCPLLMLTGEQRLELKPWPERGKKTLFHEPVSKEHPLEEQ